MQMVTGGRLLSRNTGSSAGRAPSMIDNFPEMR